MNKTFPLALLTRCRETILEDVEKGFQDFNDNVTHLSPTQTTETRSMRQSYDNAYFYILFVMFFYSFLALTLFRSFAHKEKNSKDPYEEIMESYDTAGHEYGEGSAPEKFEFEEENIV